MSIDLLKLAAWLWVGCIITVFLGLLYVFWQFIKDCFKAMGK